VFDVNPGLEERDDRTGLTTIDRRIAFEQWFPASRPPSIAAGFCS